MEGALGVEVQVAGEVVKGEEGVAQFLGDALLLALAHGGAEFGDLLVELGVGALGTLPVEADLGGLVLGALGAKEGGECGGHAVEGGGLGALALGLLDALPVAEGGLGVAGGGLAEDVGVAADELVGEGVHHVVEAEGALLLADVALEEHLQEHVAELLAMVGQVVAGHGVEQLVALLLEAGLDGLQRLGAVPRAAVGGAQACDHLFKFLKFRHKNASLPM